MWSFILGKNSGKLDIRIISEVTTMKRCPECGRLIKIDAQVCDFCGYKYTQTESDITGEPRQTRAQYHEKSRSDADEAESKTSLSFAVTCKKMLEWIHQNSNIALVIWLVLMIFTSIVPELGWTALLLLTGWLFYICRNSNQIKQYTADKNLQKDFESSTNKAEQRAKVVRQKHPKLEERVEKFKANSQKIKKTHGSIYRWGALLTSLLGLILFFAKSGMTGSISRALLQYANNQYASSQMGFAVVIYLVWLYLVLNPIFIAYRLLKGMKQTAFILSLIQTVLLLGLIFYGNKAGTVSVYGQLTKQLIATASAVGTFYYMLIFTSILTTGLCFMNIFSRKNLF